MVHCHPYFFFGLLMLWMGSVSFALSSKHALLGC